MAGNRGDYDGFVMSGPNSDHPGFASRRPEEYWALSRRIAHLGTQGVARLEFLRELSMELSNFSGCVDIRMWMTDVELDYHWHMRAGRPPQTVFEPIRRPDRPDERETDRRDLHEQAQDFMNYLQDGGRRSAGAQKSYQVHDERTRSRLHAAIESNRQFSCLIDLDEYSSVLILPLPGEPSLGGLIVLSFARTSKIPSQDCFLYEQVVETIGRAVINRRAQFRLRERIKELTCVHGIVKLAHQDDESLDAVLRAMINLLPAAMQFPEIAVARLSLDGRTYSTHGAGASAFRLAVTIGAGGRSRGELEVSYRETNPEFAAGPFLREERELLNSVAHEITMLIERAESAAAKAALAEQLRHADRLATIGQLAAGVAHELNEPLGNIMGFAQLLQKHEGLPEAAHRDADQIVQAVLHGREIVKKLLLFARQSHSHRTRLDLNALIRESLYFLEARCRRGGIDMRLNLADAPACVVAVPSEMTQVLVNLGVNAIQAMPSGGALTIGTRNEGNSVLFVVEDTGIGMDEATQRRLFTPFFTTKDVGEGTGLGLSVVLGIVSAHGGTIHVESAPSRGARFEIRLPAADATNAILQSAS